GVRIAGVDFTAFLDGPYRDDAGHTSGRCDLADEFFVAGRRHDSDSGLAQPPDHVRIDRLVIARPAEMPPAKAQIDRGDLPLGANAFDIQKTFEDIGVPCP